MAHSDANKNGALGASRIINLGIYTNESGFPVPSPESSVKMVFITKQNFSGNMNGYAGADQSCINDPNNPLGAGNGRWRALLWANPSHPANNGYSYVNTKGTVIAHANEYAESSLSEWLNGGDALSAAIIENTDGAATDQQFWTGWANYKPIEYSNYYRNNDFQDMARNIPNYNEWANVMSPNNPVPFNFFQPQSTSDTDVANYAANFNCNNWTNGSDANMGGVYGNNMYWNSGDRNMVYQLVAGSVCGNIVNQHVGECSRVISYGLQVGLPSIAAIPDVLLFVKFLRYKISSMINKRRLAAFSRQIDVELAGRTSSNITPYVEFNRAIATDPDSPPLVRMKAKYRLARVLKLLKVNSGIDDSYEIDCADVALAGGVLIGSLLILGDVIWQIADITTTPYVIFMGRSWSGIIYNQYTNNSHTPIVLARHPGINVPTNPWSKKDEYTGTGIDNKAPDKIVPSTPSQTEKYTVFPYFGACTEQKPILCTGPYEN